MSRVDVVRITLRHQWLSQTLGRVARCVVVAAAIGLPSRLIGQRTMALTPIVRIDGESMNLVPIGDLAVSAAGAIAISQPQDHAVIVFDSLGRLVARVGRRGEGPGEFESMAGWMAWYGDSLFVYSISNRRGTIVVGGRTAGTLVIPTLGSAPGAVVRLPAGVSSLAARSRPGASLLFRFGADRPFNSSLRLQDPEEDLIVRADRTGAISGLAAENPTYRNDLCQAKVGGAIVVAPFCTTSAMEVSRDAGLVVTVRPIGVSRSQWRVRVVSLHPEAGDTVFDRVLTLHAEPISRHIADSVRNRLASRRGLPPAARDAYASLPLPQFYPPFVQVMIAGAGRVWLERDVPSGSPRGWVILGADGRTVGSLVVPRNVALRFANDRAVWATVSEPDGVEDIVRYRVR